MVRVAIVGTGIAGRVHHIPALKNHQEVEIVAICKKNDDLEMKSICTELNCSGYTNYDLMLKQEKPDAVIIATPSSTHFDLAIKSLDNQCHTLVEKPMTYSVRQAQILAKYAKNKNLILGCAFQRRLRKDLQDLRKKIKDQHFGEIYQIEVSVPLRWQYRDKTIKSYFGSDYITARNEDPYGILADIGSHYIDAVIWLTGLEPEYINSVKLSDYNTEYHVGLLVKFKTGQIATINIGGRAYVYPDLVEPKIVLYFEKATVVVKTNSVIIINDTLVDEWEENKSNTSCAVNFVNSILGKEKIACPAEETILSIGVIEKAYELMA